MVLVAGVSSCIGFVVWLNRPGKLLDPEKLLGADTTGYVEWTLRLEDPGSMKLFRSLLELSDQQGLKIPNAAPSGLSEWFTKVQHGRNEMKLRELFPLVAAWTVRPGETPGSDLHLLTLSLEKLGNRVILVDSVLDFALSWSKEVETVPWKGETIHHIPLRHGHALTFFIRGNDLFFSSDVDTARRVVDRLTESAEDGKDGRPGVETAGSGRPGAELRRLLAETSKDHALRGAIVNRDGMLGRVWEWVAGAKADEADSEHEPGYAPEHEPAPAGNRTQTPAPKRNQGPGPEGEQIRTPGLKQVREPEPNDGTSGFPWQQVEAATLQGGFSPEGDLDLRIEVLGPDEAWTSAHAKALEQSVSAALARAGLEPKMVTSTLPGRLRIDVTVPDIPGRLRRLVDDAKWRAQRAH